jgi:hypothetical protein
VIWNLDRYFKPDAPQADPTGGAFARARDPWIVGYRKIDDYTVEISNPRPISYFPGALAYLFFSSPGQSIPEDRLVDRVRQVAVRHRAVQDHRIPAARQRHVEPQRRVLGQEPRANARPDGADPDAGSHDPARSTALGPSRLDRGAAA